MSLPENLQTTTQTHLEQLVIDQVREGQHLDFKRELPAAWNDAAKHEFLADATAFANSGGGDLIFGVDEDGHAQASALVSQAIANVDQEVRRLQDFLLNLAEPRLPGVRVQAVPVVVAGTNGYVLVVRVPQSWAGPHRVKTNQHFFIRDGLRKRQLDVPEIRSLFLRTENQAQKVKDFRTERLGKILSGEAPHQLVDGPVLVAHLIPTQAALGLVQVDPIPYVANLRPLPVIGTTGAMPRLNLDGALAVRNETPNGETHGYSQLFRNGFFESTYVLTRTQDVARAILPSLKYERDLIHLLDHFRGELDHMGLNRECAVMLSLLHANQVKLGVNPGAFDEPHQRLFDRNTLVLPDVVAQSDTPPEQALKPAFDLIWQAAGFIGSRNYNRAGVWAPN
jgi:hypothetical protein